MTVKNVIRFFSSMRPADTNRAMIIPFWFLVTGLTQIFHPMFEDWNREYTFTLAVTYALSILTYWIVDLILVVLRPPEVSNLPNLPYDLFYHYRLKNTDRDGFIYLVRRLRDGIYKVGKANDLGNRIKSLQGEYGPVAVIAVWEVADCGACEKVALDRTKEFTHRELDHRELRCMDNWQCWQFINGFTQYVAALDMGIETVDRLKDDGQLSLWVQNEGNAD